jgi:hypothetical protein
MARPESRLCATVMAVYVLGLVQICIDGCHATQVSAGSGGWGWGARPLRTVHNSSDIVRQGRHIFRMITSAWCWLAAVMLSQR